MIRMRNNAINAVMVATVMAATLALASSTITARTLSRGAGAQHAADHCR
jgi:hypothetical protein